MSKPSTVASCGRMSFADDLDTDQRLYGGDVLRAAHPLNADVAGLRGARVGVQCVFEPRDEGIDFLLLRLLAPGGGIRRPRSLRTAFSQISAWSPAALMSSPCSASSAHLDPVLWQE